MGMAQATMRQQSKDCLPEESDPGCSRSLPASPTATTSSPGRCPEEDYVCAARDSGATSGSAMGEPKNGPGSILGRPTETQDSVVPWSKVGDTPNLGNEARRRCRQGAESQDTQLCFLGATRTKERPESVRGEISARALHGRGFSDSESDASTSDDGNDDEEEEEGGGSVGSSSSGDDESGWDTYDGGDEKRGGFLVFEPLVSLREKIGLAFERSPWVTRELDWYSDASSSSWNARASSESSGSSRPSSVSSGSIESLSGTLLSLRHLSRKKRRSKEHGSFSMWRGRRSGGSKTTDACIQAGEGELLSEKDLTEEKTLTDLREEDYVCAARDSGATSGSAMGEPKNGPGSILGRPTETQDSVVPWSKVGDAPNLGNKARRRCRQGAESQDTRLCFLGARKTKERPESVRGKISARALHGRGFSDCESDASTSDDGNDDEEEEEGGGSVGSSSSGDDESGWDTCDGGDKKRGDSLGRESFVSLCEEVGLAFEGSPCEHGGSWASSQELDWYSDASSSSSSARASSESSGSSRPSSVSSGRSESSSGTLLSLGHVSRKKRRSKEHGSFSMWRGRRSGGSKTTDACIQAGEGELLSEKDLTEEKTLTDLRWRVRMSRLELGRERFHSEVVKQEQARMRKQLAMEYEARIGVLKKQVRDDQLFRDKVLDKLAQCECDNHPRTVGRDPVGKQEEGDDATAEVEDLRQSNAKLKTELEDLRRAYEKQGAVLREEREALAKSERHRCRAVREMEIARMALKMILEPDGGGVEEVQEAAGENGFVGNPKVGDGSDTGSGGPGGCREDGRVDVECGSGGVEVQSGGVEVGSGGPGGCREDGRVDVECGSGGVEVQSGGVEVGSGGTGGCQEDGRVDVECGSGGVEVQSGGVEVQSGGVEVQSGGVEVQSGGVEVQSGGVEVQSGGVEAQSGGVEAQSGGVWESTGRSEVCSGDDAGGEGGGDRGKDVGVGQDGTGCRVDVGTAEDGSDFGNDSREIPYKVGVVLRSIPIRSSLPIKAPHDQGLPSN